MTTNTIARSLPTNTPKPATSSHQRRSSAAASTNGMRQPPRNSIVPTAPMTAMLTHSTSGNSEKRNPEYSGFRFSLFPLVEWVNIAVIGAVGTMLFLGGWRIPFVDAAALDRRWWLDVAGFGVFVGKDLAIVFVVIWIRWTLPRFRVDQMMNLCWKYFIPFSFVCFVGELAWYWLVPGLGQRIVSVATFAVFGVGFGGWFGSRVRYNARRYHDLVLNDAL